MNFLVIRPLEKQTVFFKDQSHATIEFVLHTLIQSTSSQLTQLSIEKVIKSALNIDLCVQVLKQYSLTPFYNCYMLSSQRENTYNYKYATNLESLKLSDNSM